MDSPTIDRRCSNILIVDDNHGDVRLLTESLESILDGHGDIRSATNGWDGAAFLSLHGTRYVNGGDPDLIILDLNMPVMNGFDFLVMVRSLPAWDDVTIFVLSSTNRPHEIENVLRHGADRFIRKPSDWEEYCTLATAIATHVRNPGTWDAASIFSMARSDKTGVREWKDSTRAIPATGKHLSMDGRMKLVHSRRCEEYQMRFPSNPQ